MNTILKNWKTTVNGILAFLIATLGTVSAFLIAQATTLPAQSHKLMWVSIAVNLGLALCRAWVGLLQTDSKPSS